MLVGMYNYTASMESNMEVSKKFTQNYTLSSNPPSKYLSERIEVRILNICTLMLIATLLKLVKL